MSLLNLQNILSIIAKNKEVSIILMVLLVLMMIIVPIPPDLMDLIIVFNIGMTVLILMVVLYIDSPLKLTTFPNILLFLALLRIGITVSTSRLILLTGDAGNIVSTFGGFMVSGNIVVGVIIFVIVTIINFIVITKGSERVAEVAARFSLDAMPGKQMSIDSDLRAENITMAEAKELRNNLGLESKLFGAMDGAMKFVKGDAIASIIDILINLVGGLVIGMAQHNMQFGDAIKTYSILTIGDGLVQQLPSLLISLTAGMMITRVSDDTKDKMNLGQHLIKQVFTNYRALFSAAGALVLFSLIPGMPIISFLLLATLLAILAFAIYRKTNVKGKDKAKTSGKLLEEETTPEQNNGESFIPWQLSPLLLSVSQDFKTKVYFDNIKKSLENIQREFLYDLGVEVPQILLRNNAALSNNSYQVLLFEIPVATGVIVPNKILFLERSQEKLDSLNVDTTLQNDIDIGEAFNGIWIDESHAIDCTNLNYRFLTSEQFIHSHLHSVLSKNVGQFLGMQEVKNILDKMKDYEELIREILRMLPLNKVTEIMQRLVAEGVSIRNFKVILDTMLEWGQREKEIIIITEYVRKSLGRYIAHKITNGNRILPCIVLDSELEDMVRDSIRFTATGSYLDIDPSIATAIIQNINQLLTENITSQKVAIVTQLDIRRYFKSMLEKESCDLTVLSFQELDTFVEFDSLGVIELPA